MNKCFVFPLCATFMFLALCSPVTSFINLETGSFPDAQLPSKRIIGPKNYELLTSKREEFEEYLQVTVMMNK